MTDATGYIAVLDGAVQDWRWKTQSPDEAEASYYSEQEEEAKVPYSIPPQNVTTALDAAVADWRSTTQAQHEYDDALAWELEKANICPSCDGFHPDQSGWAGERCTVATGIEWYHWRPANEEGW